MENAFAEIQDYDAISDENVRSIVIKHIPNYKWKSTN